MGGQGYERRVFHPVVKDWLMAQDVKASHEPRILSRYPDFVFDTATTIIIVECKTCFYPDASSAIAQVNHYVEEYKRAIKRGLIPEESKVIYRVLAVARCDDDDRLAVSGAGITLWEFPDIWGLFPASPVIHGVSLEAMLAQHYAEFNIPAPSVIELPARIEEAAA